MILPWQRAKEWHEEHISTETFEQCLGWHMSRGVVYSAPDGFMLANEARWDEDREEIDIGGEEPNAWMVELASAEGPEAFARFMRTAPHAHKWVLWCRRGEFRVRAFSWEKLIRKLRV